MNCQEAESHLVDALSGAPLMPDAKAHIDSCLACREAIREMEATHQILQQGLPEPPPPELRTAFYERLNQLRSETTAPSPGWWSRLGESWRPYALAGAFAVIFLIGFGLASARRTPPPGPEVMLVQLQSASPADRLSAAYEILSQDLGDTTLRDALLHMMQNDPNVNVRIAAVEALAHFSQQASVQQGVMRALLSDPSPNLQMAALHIVEFERPPDLATVLAQLLKRTDLEPLVRDHATTILGSMIS